MSSPCGICLGTFFISSCHLFTVVYISACLSRRQRGVGEIMPVSFFYHKAFFASTFPPPHLHAKRSPSVCVAFRPFLWAYVESNIHLVFAHGCGTMQTEQTLLQFMRLTSFCDSVCGCKFSVPIGNGIRFCPSFHGIWGVRLLSTEYHKLCARSWQTILSNLACFRYVFVWGGCKT